LREDYAPGHIVVPDQLFDNTKHRDRSFFGKGLVAHVNAADPFCGDLSAQLERALRETDATVHLGGAFITIEGPRFSTKAESHTYRSWGMSLIGMTTSPEAFLAREAELCYAVMAHVTDYDVWHTSESPVTVDMVIQTLNKNTQYAQEAIRVLVRSLSESYSCDCDSALQSALITTSTSVPGDTKKNLDLLIRKYFE
jgi:5'-methylthioadenosine phosphorylase